MVVKVKDFSPEMLVEICSIVNRGNEALVKRERNCVVIVEVRRKALIKNEIVENQFIKDIQVLK